MATDLPLRLARTHMRRTTLLLAFGLLAVVCLSGSLAAQKSAVVYVAPIEGIIDLGLAPLVQRVLDEATREGAAAVVLEINIFGGRSTRRLLIRDALLNARLRTVAFVNKRAISASGRRRLGREVHRVGSGNRRRLGGRQPHRRAAMAHGKNKR